MNAIKKLKLAVAIIILCVKTGFSQRLSVSELPSKHSFPLVFSKESAALYIDNGEEKVVHIAASALISDIKTITNVKIPLVNQQPFKQQNVIIAGTIGHSEWIDRLIASGKINVNDIKGKWEAFKIVQIAYPDKGIENALLVVGSDRRATAFGLFEISRKIGVSPFYWWADITPAKKKALYLQVTKEIVEQPSVKYRGIFLNDEDWGLQPWAAKHMDTDIKDIGPNTYTKIFELLLRLKANYIWPAMHPSTKAFYYYKENPKIANDYAIVVGSSHCEPMLRNNVFEWAVNYENEYGAKPGEWRYDLNKQQIDQYWFDRVVESHPYESVYTIGMRGIHDGGMPGPKDRGEKVKLLNDVIRIQRRMLEDNSTKSIKEIPQIFCPYKEVLTLYRSGLELPEDVTIVWADDNHGYIRQLSNPKEQERSGGSGVYYHLSYWGAPQDYLWLSSTSPALVSYELYKAYQYGAKDLWVINVGDIKPAELETQFAMDLAWDIDKWKPQQALQYVKHWATETFGVQYANEITAIKNKYYELAASGKPEHIPFIQFTEVEKNSRLAEYQKLTDKAKQLQAKIPVDLQDAYYQLIYYPVVGSKLMNEKHFYAQQSLLFAEQGNPEALKYATKAKEAFEQIKSETEKYNTKIAHGKWDGIMEWKPRNREVFLMPKVAEEKDILQGNKREEVEKTHVVKTIKADQFTIQNKGEISIEGVDGLGINGLSMALFPLNTDALNANDLQSVPYLRYEWNDLTGEKEFLLKTLPTQGVYEGRNVRMAISVNNQPVQVMQFNPKSEDATWAKNVLRGYAVASVKLPVKSGKNEIKIYLLDPGAAFNQLEIF
ncbi:hypothetical protein Pedsa_3736 [Pseudopedobacter saltans DSM 12145]|uniref:Gylcosyl hydrolase 115 C-terminal domain-containing protein n=1 Tax=Pseudopedobacter saltans (strain ATCC 51119 / DSM 12145 / JCM 21818 / CCUG 39354 / LMG 10337 / NBRC 100064 / NCIMB 13643) TaxID=762903 RepID=F0S6D9_PSESL|nr:glycosyl hydrolase 115 family protein [Pseudopedobacter saltans]ADY54265.1 hypothetical protein Pedsa_3736 [Pseudopedobacter saltans DSM 12145]